MPQLPRAVPRPPEGMTRRLLDRGPLRRARARGGDARAGAGRLVGHPAPRAEQWRGSGGDTRPETRTMAARGSGASGRGRSRAGPAPSSWISWHRLPGIDLGGETLGRPAETPEGSLWWFLDITEKGAVPGAARIPALSAGAARAVIEPGGLRRGAGQTRERPAGRRLPPRDRPCRGWACRIPGDTTGSLVGSAAAYPLLDSRWGSRSARLAVVRAFLGGGWFPAAAAADRAGGVHVLSRRGGHGRSRPTPRDRFFSHPARSGGRGLSCVADVRARLWRNRARHRA